ncbi:MAG: hypothetical protein K2K53_01320, partial [Oscillospiraceae bacterium]|nr:hypothetical protein [Oscillospiraceae bacterium]
MGYTVTCASGTVLRVTGTGELDLTGTIEAKSGTGVEVESGGILRVGSADISGTTYGLVIASGADVKLSGGTFSGGTAAIQADDYAELLEDGCAFFDSDGNPVRPEDMGTVTKVTVGGCSAHDLKSYETNAGTPEHTWTCDACGAVGVEKCTFDTFTDGDNDGSWEGACGDCGNVLTITVVRNSLKELAYGDGKTIEPTAGTVTVTVKDAAAALIEGTDYTVDYSTHTDVGNTDVTVTVTVEGTAYEGEAFTEDYIFTAAELTRPVLEWASTGDVAVTYDGSAVEKGDLPNVTINLTPNTGLDQYLQYSYRKLGETAYTSGLPTNAGDYEVVATLPEELAGEEAGHAVSTEPIALHILKADPLAEIPTAKTLTYNREAQELVTEGKLKPEAAADGAVILFAASENGGYSTAIPSGIDAKDYSVWYKVEATDNCNAVGPAEITGVKIQRKPITPIVTLSKDSYQYDGEYKKPTVTVKDEDNVTVLLDSEYNVKYENNQNVSTEEKPAKVVITDKTGGNYAITKVEVTFEITLKEQQTLSITKQPDVVTYGDRFTLGTTGGSGSGAVTWTITDGSGVAEVGLTSGQVKITGHGEFTVKATKSGTDPTTNVKNYNDATATWTITADKKSVVAVVTAEDKVYGETYGTGSLDEAKVHAVVEQGVLPDDEITITGLTGKFADENAGKDIEVTVTLPASDPISGTNSEHYDVTYSSLKVKATIYKADIKIGTDPQDDKSLTYNRDSQALLASGAVVIDKTTGQTVTVPVEYALSEEGPYYTDFPKGTNAGDYKVWFRVPETLNYNGIAPDSVDASIKPMRVTPEITLSGDGLTGGPGSYSYVYDGSAKTPAVTVKETAGGAVIPEDGNYTVTYSNNINVGTSAKVTVAAKAGGNYEFTPSSIDVSFAITKEPAKVLTAPEAAGDPLTFNTRAQKLVTPGAGYGGTMVYSVDNGTTYQEQIPTKTDAGDYTVLYKVQGDDNHSDSAVGTVAVTIAAKTVANPTIELTLVDENGDPLLDGDGNPATSYTYDGKAKKPEVVVKDGSDVIPAGEYNVIYRNNTDAGDAVVSITDKANGNYTVTGSTTFVIQKADLVDPNPQDAGVTYNGEPQPLLTVTPVSGGEIWYALGNLTGPTSAYTDMIPQATNAGDYYVYYKVVGDKNHNDILQKGPVHAAIKRQEPDAITIVLSPEGFKYDGGVKMPGITVKVGEVVLPETEYSTACTAADGTAENAPTTVGTYTIT